jgi:hypothetical protein
MRVLFLLAAALPLAATDSVRIWAEGAHNAFTDLTRHRNQWLCVFREGRAHVSTDGAIRIITSDDGKLWKSAARLTMNGADLRDPKITHTPQGDLMLTAGGAYRERDNQHPVPQDSFVWFSKDGRKWSEPVKIGDGNFWLWRATWHAGSVYMVGYDRAGTTRLYASKDGKQFTRLADPLVSDGRPNEATILFRKDGAALCLLRREEGTKNGWMGRSRAPYKDWEWSDVGARIGGPNFIELPDGRLIGVVRLYEQRTRTSIVTFDEKGALRELETLPSSGDSSYAGLVWHRDELWISYYSSHEGKTSIYLARWRPPSKSKA